MVNSGSDYSKGHATAAVNQGRFRPPDFLKNAFQTNKKVWQTVFWSRSMGRSRRKEPHHNF
jgi:hypothetical protein